MSGYRDFTLENFKIIRYQILCPQSLKKSQIKFLYHLYSDVDCGEYSEYKDFGYYYYYKSILNRDLKWIINHTIYGKRNKESFDFEILEVDSNNNIWNEGFDLMDDNEKLIKNEFVNK